MKASAKEIGKAQSIAERTAAPVDPRLRPKRFQDIRPDVANDLAQGAARLRSALAPKVIGVGDLRIAKPNPRCAAPFDAKMNACHPRVFDNSAINR